MFGIARCAMLGKAGMDQRFHTPVLDFLPADTGDGGDPAYPYANHNAEMGRNTGHCAARLRHANLHQ
jgi:hypothetical protein